MQIFVQISFNITLKIMLSLHQVMKCTCTPLWRTSGLHYRIGLFCLCPDFSIYIPLLFANAFQILVFPGLVGESVEMKLFLPMCL